MAQPHGFFRRYSAWSRVLLGNIAGGMLFTGMALYITARQERHEAQCRGLGTQLSAVDAFIPSFHRKVRKGSQGKSSYGLKVAGGKFVDHRWSASYFA